MVFFEKTWILKETSIVKPSSLAETIALIRINETVIFSKENGKEMLALQTSYVSSPPATKCPAGET